jgi:hypothetical protein
VTWTLPKQKRKSQGIADDGDERGDPETRNQRVGQQLLCFNAQACKWQHNRAAIRSRDNPAHKQNGGESNKMVVNLVKNTQSDVTGDIFAHHAMFPEQEHDLTNLVLGWCIRPGR